MHSGQEVQVGRDEAVSERYGSGSRWKWDEMEALRNESGTKWKCHAKEMERNENDTKREVRRNGISDEKEELGRNRGKKKWKWDEMRKW